MDLVFLVTNEFLSRFSNFTFVGDGGVSQLLILLVIQLAGVCNGYITEGSGMR